MVRHVFLMGISTRNWLERHSVHAGGQWGNGEIHEHSCNYCNNYMRTVG